MPVTPHSCVPEGRRKAAAVAAATALLALAVGAQAPVAAASSASSDTGRTSSGATSGNWSGYAATSSTYHSVSATWVEPKVSCEHTGAVSIWVGLDGLGTHTVEQTGVQAECNSVNGTPRYFAWYEDYPDPESTYPDTVKAGDSLTASVVYNSSTDNYTAKLTNNTRGWSEIKTLTHYKGATNGSAEVIAEAPSRNGSRVPLADYGSVTFTKATIDGQTLADAKAKTVTMAHNGTTSAVPGPLSGSGDSFTDTWKHT
ncbi:G1 family glutamic endopeptidase [Kitasatospora sp. NPDC001159]